MSEMRRAIARQEQEMTKVMEAQRRMTDRFASDAGHCRVNHCGSTAFQGARDQQAIASSNISGNGQHWAGENDP